MDADKAARGLRAELAQARAQDNADAERAARKRMAALGVAAAAPARRTQAEAVETPKEAGDDEPHKRAPQDRRLPQRQRIIPPAKSKA